MDLNKDNSKAYAKLVYGQSLAVEKHETSVPVAHCDQKIRQKISYIQKIEQVLKITNRMLHTVKTAKVNKEK